MNFLDKDKSMAVEKNELDDCIRYYKRFISIQ